MGTLNLLQNYLHGGSLSVVVNGQSSTECPSSVPVPQGSVIGPLLWNVFFSDILQLMLEASAYEDEYTMSFTCKRDDHHRTHYSSASELRGAEPMMAGAGPGLLARLKHPVSAGLHQDPRSKVRQRLTYTHHAQRWLKQVRGSLDTSVESAICMSLV